MLIRSCQGYRPARPAQLWTVVVGNQSLAGFGAVDAEQDVTLADQRMAEYVLLMILMSWLVSGFGYHSALPMMGEPSMNQSGRITAIALSALVGHHGPVSVAVILLP